MNESDEDAGGAPEGTRIDPASKQRDNTGHPSDSGDEATVFRPTKPAVDEEKTRIAPVQAGEAEDETRIAPGRAGEGGSDGRTRIAPVTHRLEAEAEVRRSDPTRLVSLLGLKTARERIHSGESEAKVMASGALVLQNRFVLESVLGAGGMGTVYKARDLRKVEARDSDPHVAAKVLNEDFKDHPDAFVSLHREAKKSQMLAHPNIITVHDFDRDGDVTFMTMELLKGKSLDNILRKNPTGLPKQQVFKIVSAYCAALGYAHEKSIIHLDFKPGNIFISDEDEVKVLDFGIARVAAEKRDEQDFDAGSLGAVTPAYASLEMLRWEEPAPSDDVYAAACVAYELFTGEHPYQRKPADVALEQKLKPKRIESLSKRKWKALASGLALKREERTQTIKEFQDGLTGVNKPPYIIAAALVILALTGGLVYSQFFAADDLSGVIQETLAKGQECMGASDYQCAIDSAAAVLRMDAEHPDAKTLLVDAKLAQTQAQIEQLHTRGMDCAQQRDFKCAEDMADDIKALDPSADQLKALLAKIKTQRHLQSVETGLAQARACMKDKDYPCAVEKAEALLALDAKLKEAGQIKQEAEDIIKKRQANAAERHRKASAAIARAERCFKAKDYNCALTKVKTALQYEPRNQVARALQDRVKFARQQYDENKRRVDGLLAQGKDCLDNKKNYKCAISKSDSALAILPGYPKAVALRKEAIEEEKKAKAKAIEQMNFQ